MTFHDLNIKLKKTYIHLLLIIISFLYCSLIYGYLLPQNTIVSDKILLCTSQQIFTIVGVSHRQCGSTCFRVSGLLKCGRFGAWNIVPQLSKLVKGVVIISGYEISRMIYMFIFHKRIIRLKP